MKTDTKFFKSGHEAMEAWNKSWRVHHIPVWAKKSIRLNAIQKGIWKANWPGHITAESLLPNDLFDHWGSIKRDGMRIMITQPYGNHDDSASRFADEMGWCVRSFTPGPWNGGTWCYEFTPPFLSKTLLQSIVNGSIKCAIDAHGPITKENYSSAGKRISGQILSRLWIYQIFTSESKSME